MPKRRRIDTSDMPRSGNVIYVSTRQMWELSWVRKLGLEDIDWNPARYCEHCRAERADRGDAVEDIVPPSGTQPRFLPQDDGEHTAPSVGASRARSERGGTPRPPENVLSPQPERTDP
ncbi:hypothetical protein [Sorangium sp. So ce124]|uniref:hypothetical protein n=1 Tax=Sorangium sp. So ce124 TaxID=3133280 RepID=UPI003F60769A